MPALPDQSGPDAMHRAASAFTLADGSGDTAAVVATGADLVTDPRFAGECAGFAAEHLVTLPDGGVRAAAEPVSAVHLSLSWQRSAARARHECGRREHPRS